MFKLITTAVWANIEADCQSGQMSVREIAAKHGVSHAAIYNRINRDGWTRNRLQPLSKPLLTTNASPCDACGLRKSCAAEHMACDRFIRFVEGESPIRWFNAPAAPTKACYAAVFEVAA